MSDFNTLCMVSLVAKMATLGEGNWGKRMSSVLRSNEFEAFVRYSFTQVLKGGVD